MRRIADLTPEEAIDLWWDNGDELSALFSNEKIKEAKKGKNSDFVKAIIRECPNEIKKVLLWLDPEPITPFNLFPRVLDFILGMQSEGTADFFTSASKTEASTVSADATENTEEKAN